MAVLAKLQQFLDANGTPYEVLTHRPAFTAQGVAAAQHVPGPEVADAHRDDPSRVRGLHPPGPADDR